MTQLGRIYKIVSDSHPEKYYIGSTFLPIDRRMSAHVYYYDQYVTHGIGKPNYAHQILQYKDARIELVEEFMCNDRDELRRKEAEVFKQYRGSIVNKNSPIDTNETRRLKQLQYQQKYRTARRACPQCGYCGGTSSSPPRASSDGDVDPAEWACA